MYELPVGAHEFYPGLLAHACAADPDAVEAAQRPSAARRGVVRCNPYGSGAGAGNNGSGTNLPALTELSANTNTKQAPTKGALDW